MGSVRFGVSMESKLIEAFDKHIAEKGYGSRSEAIRDLVRDNLVQQQEWTSGTRETMATVNLVFDHHHGDVTEGLTSLEHDHLHMIVSTLHVHLDHHNCLEVIVLRGTPSEIKRFSDRLISTKGVKHGKLTPATTGKSLT
jgi:CopG family transcriptional regulator, nickel-responsive regulator